MPVDVLKPDLTPLDDFEVTSLEAGQDSDVVSFALRNSTGQDLVDLLLVIQLESPLQPGLFVSTGFPPQEELWARVRLTGQDNAAAPAQQLLRTEWTPIGAYAALAIRDLLAGGIRLGEIKMHPPSSAQPFTYRWRMSLIYQEHARAVPPALTATRRGVLTHVGDRAHSGVVSGCEVTVSGAPDDEIHVAAGAWVYRGRFRTKLATDHTLNQLDGNAEALAAAQSYWAAISLGAAGVAVTKGARAANPARPAAPETNAQQLYVKVSYQAGGTSVIAAADVDGEIVYDRYLPVAGDGRQVLINAGQALAASTWRYHSAPTAIALDPEVTSWIWQLAPGSFEATQTSEPPDPTALILCEADTDADVVTALRDRRVFADDTIVLHLWSRPLDADSQVVQHEALAIERLVYRLSDNGGGASGQTVLDVEINGDTLYTSQATDDQRPSFAFDAVQLASAGGLHELVELRAGDVVTLVRAEEPAGGTPEWAEVYLICRRAI